MRGQRDGGGKGRSRQSILMLLCRSIAWKVNEVILQSEVKESQQKSTKLKASYDCDDGKLGHQATLKCPAICQSSSEPLP